MIISSKFTFIGLTWSNRPLWSPHLNIWELIFDWPGLADLPPNKMLISQMIVYGITLACRSPTLHLQTYAPVKCWFHRWLCMGSHTAPTDHLILHLQIYPHQMAISQIPALTAHISFLLWELIFGRSSVGRSNPIPSSYVNFTDSCSDSSYFTLLWELIFGRPDVGRSTHYPSNGDYRFLLWKFIFGRPNVGRSTPHQIAISQIPVLTAHISFLLWELIFGRPGVGRSNPHQNRNFRDPGVLCKRPFTHEGNFLILWRHIARCKCLMLDHWS